MARPRRAGLNDPFVGLQDAGNAARAAGLVRIRDLGDPTRREIDSLFKVLTTLQRRKHFYGLWDFCERRELDAIGPRGHRVDVGRLDLACFRPGLPGSSGGAARGYRAFAGIYSISNAVTDPAKLRACYDFINWWNSGYAGAEMLRSGYLSAVEATSRRFMPADEYAYWLEGKPAARDYKSPSGDIVARKGRTADGGPFTRRACRIASWNSWPREAGHFHAALVRVRLDVLGRSDRDPDFSQPGRERRRVAADRESSSRPIRCVSRSATPCRPRSSPTQTDPSPSTMPTGSRPTRVDPTIRFDRGSIRTTLPPLEFVTQTDPPPTAIPPGSKCSRSRPDHSVRRGIDAEHAAQGAVEHPDSSLTGGRGRRGRGPGS